MIKSYGTLFLELEETLTELESLSKPVQVAMPAIGQGVMTGLLGFNLPSPTIPQPATPTATSEIKPVVEGKPTFSGYIDMRLKRLDIIARGLGFKRTLSQIGHLRDHLEETRQQIDTWSDEALQHEVKFLRRAFRDDLEEQPIFLPNIQRSVWFRHENPFGDKVYEAFPRIRQDITAAGSCFATDNPTATVFHLMRVVEQSFRILARKLRVKGLKSDLDYEDFKLIYGALNDKLKQLRNSKRGKRREREISFYADMADRCQFFKEMWRDNVMHSRQNYDDNEAASILGRVRELIQRLAERVSDANPNAAVGSSSSKP